jgi:hypothetical protein
MPGDSKKWYIFDYQEEFDTLLQCYNFIDSKIGGWATKRRPKRLDQNKD